ncbi:MAG: PLP-dependent aminotransferase family protein [Burkholderiales bacterium]|nr:PLP-dependent aminotransferase family protein [Burkholderiales bacterium]
MNLYEHTARTVASLIENGTLRPGDRIPSVRRLSLDAGVSASTVLQAYALLETQGLVEARPQSGYYVRQPLRPVLARPQPSTPRRRATRVDVSELVFTVLDACRDPKLVPLGSPFPAPELLPLAILNQTLGAVARRASAASILKDLPPGHPELRRQIARRYLEFGCSIPADDIVITTGAMEALNLCLRAVAKPGDAIAIESPAFYGILQVIENADMKAVEIATDPQRGIDLGALSRALRQRAIKACFLMPTFQNPLGALMPDDAKRDLVALLEQFDVPLIEDDVYGELHFSKARPRPAKAFDRKGLVLHCGSFAKHLAPGYRVGWVTPGRYRERIERLKFMNTLATASLPQAAIAEFLAHRSVDRHLRPLRQTLMRQLDGMSAAVSRYFPAGTRVTRPEGGYQLWVELPESVDALELFRLALDHDISLAPGPIFSAHRGFGHCIRLNFGQIVTDRTRAALRTVGELAQTAPPGNRRE